MNSVAFGFVIALIVTALCTPLVRRFALAVGAVDAPTARRVHTRKVARLGGIVIVIGFFVPLLALYLLQTSTAHIFFSNLRLPIGLFIGALLVTGLGLYDDIVGAGAKMKLFVQVMAACAAYAGGLHIDAISLPLVGVTSMGWLALPATILWITAIVNALNLIDGLDGLAAGVAFFACLTNFVVAYLGGNPLIALVSATLAGSIIGFLFYNFNPAKIFMGDSGSLFLGYVLACSSLLGASSTKTPTLIAILVPLIALGLPIMDMLFAIARRFLERRSIFAADRGHIHHRLLDVGLTHRRAVLTLYGLSFAFTATALTIHIGRSWQIGGILIVLAVALVAIVRFVGYFNAALAASQTGSRDGLTERLRRALPMTLVRIAAEPDPDELPRLLEAFARDNGLLSVALASPDDPERAPWRWDSPEFKSSLRDSVSVRFTILDARSVASELHFHWDSPTTTATPQCEILLQIVADACEALLTRSAVTEEAVERVPAAHEAPTSSGRVRTTGIRAELDARRLEPAGERQFVVTK